MFIYIAKVIHWAFLAYTIMLVLRIAGSWFPRLAFHPYMRYVRFLTDPYLNIFRRLIPPIGGALDLSPMIGFFALRFLENIVLWGYSKIFSLFG